MKKVFLTVVIVITLIGSGIIARKTTGTTVSEPQKIIGGWNRRGLYYVFDNNGIMKALKVSGSLIGYRQYTYSTFKMGVNSFIEYGEKGANKPRKLLLVDDVRDSTAKIAFGTSFSRADSSKGMFGTWQRTKGFTSTTWTIKPDAVRYTEIVYDTVKNDSTIVEDRTGRYRREKQEMRVAEKAFSGGRFHIKFEDGRETVVLPVLYNELIYLFDLSPAKALFVRADPESVPTYKDYKAELEKRKAKKNTVSQN